MKPVFGAISGPRLILGVFVFLILCGPARAAEEYAQNAYVGATDHRHQNMIELFAEDGFALTELYDLSRQHRIIESLLQLSIDRKFDIGLIVALCRFESDFFPADQRIMQFNVETGLMYADSALPQVWEDLDRVFNVLKWVHDGYPDGDMSDVVAYYMYGKRFCGEGGYDNLNDEMKSEIDLIISEGERYGDIIHRIRGASVIEIDGDDVVTGGLDYSGYEAPANYDEIREAYISAMLYYNPKLDEAIADEILTAIAVNASSGLYPDVDERFVMALIANESGFNPDSVSHVGAMGLGQLMPHTATKYGVDDPFNVTDNIGAIFAYLQNEFNRWVGKEPIYDYVIASYNAGAGAVSKYDGIPPYEETVNFVYRVTRVFKNFLQESEYEYLIYGKSKHYPDSPE